MEDHIGFLPSLYGKLLFQFGGPYASVSWELKKISGETAKLMNDLVTVSTNRQCWFNPQQNLDVMETTKAMLHLPISGSEHSVGRASSPGYRP